MRTIKTDITDLFVSADSFKEDECYLLDDDEARKYIINERVARFFLDKEDYRKYCEIHAKKLKLKPFAILQAHGSVDNGIWIYSDGKEDRRVQSWINQQDGKYGTLLLMPCNGFTSDERPTKPVVPYSKKSLLIFSNGKTCMGQTNLGSGGFNFEMCLPNQKEPINSYEIEYHLRKLKETAQS